MTDRYAGIDMLPECSSACVVEAAAERVVREAKAASEPEVLVALLAGLGETVVRVGHEAEPLSRWLQDGLAALTKVSTRRQAELTALLARFAPLSGNALRNRPRCSVSERGATGWWRCCGLAILAALLASAAVGACAPAAFAESETERWVRGEIGAGRVADLPLYCGADLEAELDPRQANDALWRNDCRGISAAFLERVLTTEEWRAAPAHHGVRIVGARVNGRIDLSGARVAAPVQLLNNLFEDEINLDGARFEGGLSLEGSALRGGIRGEALQVGGNLLLNGAMVHGDQLRLIGAKIAGDLRMERAILTVTDLPWWGLRVDGSLNLIGSKFSTARPGIVDARIGGSLILAEAVLLDGLDLSGTRVGDELRLGWPSAGLGPPLWGSKRIDGADTRASRDQPGAWLVLRGAHVAAFQDMDSDEHKISWPPAEPSLDLQGFSYDRFASTSTISSRPQGINMLQRDPSWFLYWLRLDPTFTRQPYQQAAAVFRAAGDPDRADAVLYAARGRELAENWKDGDYLDAAVLALLKVTIGYGLGSGYFLALIWVLGATGIGMLVLRSVPEAREKGPLWRFMASLDHLLPIVELNKEFGEFFYDPERKKLARWQLAYFGGHAVFGYVLGTFLIAALAGLTQAQ